MTTSTPQQRREHRNAMLNTRQQFVAPERRTAAPRSSAGIRTAGPTTASRKDYPPELLAMYRRLEQLKAGA